MSDVGSHLLGRRPSPPDARDYPLRVFLTDVDPLDAALAALLKSSAAKATKAWCVLATPRIIAANPTPPPTPPPPPPAAVVWADNEPVLDQGQTPHCVGFGGAQWGNTLPIDDKYTNADGDKIYYECKVVDGEPGKEDGSDVRSLAKVLQTRGRLSTYAFAASVDEAVSWVVQHGPVIMGTNWTNDMFSPDGSGFVRPTGAVAGGHCYALVGYDPADQVLTYLNSWGSSWGQTGRFHMHKADAETLFASQGEACAAVELP